MSNEYTAEDLQAMSAADLFGIQEEVAERFDDLPFEPSAAGVRLLVLTGLKKSSHWWPSTTAESGLTERFATIAG